MSSEKLNPKINILELVYNIVESVNAGHISRDEGIILLKTIRRITLRILDAVIEQVEGKE